MPLLHVVGMGFQICPQLKVRLVILEINVLSLDEAGEHDGAEGAWEFPILVIFGQVFHTI